MGKHYQAGAEKGQLGIDDDEEKVSKNALHHE